MAGITRTEEAVVEEVLPCRVVYGVGFPFTHVPIVITALVIVMTRRPTDLLVDLGGGGNSTPRTGRAERRTVLVTAGEVVFGNVLQGDFAQYHTDSHLRIAGLELEAADRKSTRLNSSHANISYAVFCLKKK